MANQEFKNLSGEIQATLKKGDYVRGLELLSQWSLTRPHDPQGWYLQAWVRTRQGYPELARLLLNKALELKPDHMEAARLLATLGPPPGSGAGATRASLAAREGWVSGQLVAGRYLIHGSKKGGMGQVYFAFDRELERMVAIKTPHRDTLESPGDRTRFFREAEAWIGLGVHPNICAAYYFFELDGLFRLFIEYVGGGSLDAWLREKPDLTLRQRMDLAIQIAAGMGHTHTFFWKDEIGGEHRGLVHRDLKPGNILMEPDGTARITDFGLVGRAVATSSFDPATQTPADSGPTRPAEVGPAPTLEGESTDRQWRTMTVAGEAMGTPPYMAPEQWRSSHKAGFAADIYAYGCILYEIFCGRRPFVLPAEIETTSTVIQLFHWQRMHETETPPDPRQLTAELDEELSRFMVRCLAKNPTARPASFSDIREELRAIFRRQEGGHLPYFRPEPRAAQLVSDALNNQGVSYQALGRTSRADEAWREALRADPLHIEATFNSALASWQRGKRPAPEAVRRMAEVCGTHALDWRGHQLLGRLLLLFGQSRQAVEALRQAARLAPTQIRVRRDLGLALAAAAGAEETDLFAHSQVLLDQVMESGHADPQVIAGLYLARRRVGPPDEARDWYARARSAYPELPESPDEAVFRFVPGKETVFLLDWPEGQPRALNVGPDGRRAVVGYEDRIELWNLHPIRPELVGTIGAAGTPEKCLNIGADGQWALMVGPTGKPSVRPLDNQEPAREVPVTGEFTLAALDPDGSMVATADAQGRISVYGMREPGAPMTWAGPVTPTALALGPQGDTVLVGSADGGISLWEPRTATLRLGLAGSGAPITAVALSPDGRYALAGGRDGMLRIWALPSGDLLKADSLGRPITALGVDSTSRLALLALSTDQAPTASMMLLVLPGLFIMSYVLTPPRSAAEIETREKEFQELSRTARQHFRQEYFQEAFDLLTQARAVTGYHRAPEAMELARELAALFPRKGLLAAWETGTIGPLASGVTRLAVTPDGRQILAAEQNGTVGIWNLETDRRIRTLKGHSDPVIGLAVDDSGRRAVTVGVDGLRWWDLKTGVELKVMTGLGGPPAAVALTQDGRYALVGGRDGKIVVWDLIGGSRREFSGRNGPVTALTLNLDGRMVVSGHRDGQVQIWNFETGRSAIKFSGPAAGVESVAISPDGRWIVAGGADHGVYRWDLHEEHEPQILTAHTAPVTAVTFDPQGRFILSASADKTMRLWSTGGRRPRRTFESHYQAVSAAIFTPDGGMIVSGGLDQVLRKWHLDWSPEVHILDFWDDGARFVLEAFLTRHTPYRRRGPVRKGRALWTDADFEVLVEEMRRRGFGWLRSQGVRHELEETTKIWQGPLNDNATPRAMDANLSWLVSLPWNTIRSRKGQLGLVLPAIILAFSLINIHRYDWMSWVALVTCLYFVFRLAIFFKK